MSVDRGLVFNQLVNLLLYQTEWFESFSDVVLNTARTAAPSPERVTPDLQLFKKIRAGHTNDIDHFFKLLYKYAPSLESWLGKPEETEVPDDVGGWWLISKIFVLASIGSEDGNDKFWVKLSELCNEEKAILNVSSEEQQSTEINRLGAKWLDMERLWEKQDGPCYVVRMVLIWLAIYEHILRHVTYGFEELNPEPAHFSKLLPQVEKGKLTLSNARFCEAFKEKWLTGAPKSWSTLYKKIAEAQGTDSVEKIKKAVEEIRSGKRNLLWTTYRDNFRVLVPEFSGKAIHETEVIVLFCQLMTKIQLELLERGLAPSEVEELFNYYPTAYKKFS